MAGIGKSTAGKIREYVDNGSMARLEALREQYPRELVELTRIPGLGPKTVLLLRDVLAEMKQEAEEEGAHGHNELLQAVAFVVKNDA